MEIAAAAAAMMAEHQKRHMRDHLAALQEIVAALAADDMSAVEKAARRIGYSNSMVQRRTLRGCLRMAGGALDVGGSALELTPPGS